MTALIKSIKNAPTKLTMSQARALEPYFSDKACITAKPFAVEPIEKPTPPTLNITVS